MADEAGKPIRTSTIEVSDNVPGPEEVKSWVDAQITYENFAGKNDQLTEDVRSFAHQLRVYYRQRMVGVYQRWKVNWYTANGNSVSSEYEDDIHVPETYKMLEAIKPRIEEALFEHDPFLEIEGVKNEIDELKAMTIAAYIRRRLELAEFRNYVAPTVQDALICQIAAIKVRWERVLEKQVIREVDQVFRKNGKPYYRYKRFLREQLAREGPVLEQVDPFRMIIDIDAGQVKDLAYIGDESDQPKSELERLADLGILAKSEVDKLEYRVPGPRDYYGAEVADTARYARSITQMWGEKENFKHKRQSKKIRTFDLWADYDFCEGYDGVTWPDGTKITGVQKVVMTLADNEVLQFRLNPFDKKFAPYGIARLNRNGHEMMGVGPFDNAVIANASYDRYQSNVMRHHDLAIAPLIRTGPDTDLPDSLLGVQPGTVFRGTGDLDIIKVPDIPSSVQYLHDFYRREHEELTGATRYWFGSEQNQGTATQFAGELQESNRRLRGYIRSYADMWRQVSLIIYWMSGQFSTQRERFKVLGKQSQLLGKYAEITPDMYMEDVDVRFLGLDNLHTYGQQLTGLLQWMNTWGPHLPAMGNATNMVELAKMHWELAVGKDTHRVFDAPTPRHMLMPQNTENMHLRRGMRVPVANEDDDMQHISEMRRDGLLEMLEDKSTPKMVRKAIWDHYSRHMLNAQKKAAQQRAEMQRARQQAMVMGQMEGAQPGQGRTPVPGGLPAMQRGMTPGPEQGRTVSRTGREGSGISQSQIGEQEQG